MGLHLLRPARIVVLATLVACVVPNVASAATLGCADDTSGVTDQTTAWEAELLSLTNAHRTSRGLTALQLDATLTKASVWKARDMARRDYMEHDDPASGAAPARSPWDRLAECGWTSGGSRAENIAAGYRSPQAVITGWLNSAGHRANIENASMRYVGFGVATSTTSTYGTYSAQMFASVAGPVVTSPPPPPTTPTPETEGGGDASTEDGGTRTPTELAVQMRGTRVTIQRFRCRSALAVAGWCWRAVTTGQIVDASGAVRASAAVDVQRHSRSGRRFVRVGRAITGSDGRFRLTATLRPARRGTASWLLRETRLWHVDAGVASVRVIARR